VTGTRFDVRRAPAGVAVAVESGAVKVDGNGAQASDAGPVTGTTLTRGLGATIRPDGSLTPAHAVDLASVLAWREGKLVFQNAPLADVAAEISRYRSSAVTVADPATGRLRLSSVFGTGNTDELLAALPQFLPVTVHTLTDGSVKISSE
jgi:transmembrane sensor